jgi:hypothetical protein
MRKPSRKPGASAKQPIHFNSAYKKRYADEARRLAEKGWLDYEMADFFRVHVKTIGRWKILHPEFAQACLIGGMPANHRVEHSLYKQALGFEIDAEEIKVIEGKVERVKVKRYIPPSPAAAIFWLKAKMGWREHDEAMVSSTQKLEAVEHEPQQAITRDTARRLLFALSQAGKLN